MSYSRTEKKINRSFENGKQPSVPKSIFMIFVVLGVLGLFMFALITRAFILLIPALILLGVLHLYFNKDEENEKSRHSKRDYLNDLRDKQKAILDKWIRKFKPDGLDMIEYEERIQIEDLIEEYDRKSNEYKDLEYHLNTISKENPQRIKELKDEIVHFGYTIDENDEEYISRMNEIKSLGKEIKQTELNLINLDKGRQMTEDEIFSLVRNQKKG